MKKLQILRVDNDLVQKMDLQIGNNIIGRSVTIGSDDERIIKQAVTINVAPDHEMTITPHQVSPCYMRSTESKQWKLLKLGTTVPIKPGYICSLVPDKCCFKIISVPDKMDNNEEYAIKRKPKEDVDAHIANKKLCSGEGDNLRSQSNTLMKMVTDDSITNVNNEKNDADDKNSIRITIEDKTNDSSSEVISKCQRIGEPRTVNKDAWEIQNSGQISSKPFAYQEASSLQTDLNMPSASENNKNIKTEDMPPAASTKTHVLDCSTNSKANSRRKKCKYANKCYRKSSEHKIKFSHPTDSDYDIPDDRKECPYGKKCYRKNPQHKIEYKHTGKNIGKEYNKRSCKQTRIQRPLDISSGMEDSSEDESAEESVDESEYEPSTDMESSGDDEMYSDKDESDWEDDAVI